MLHSKLELLDDVVLPGALDCRTQIGDDINEMRDQLRKQVARLTELRIKKVEEPGACHSSVRRPLVLIRHRSRCLLQPG